MLEPVTLHWRELSFRISSFKSYGSFPFLTSIQQAICFFVVRHDKKKRGRKGFQNFEVSSLSLPPFFLGRHGTTQLGIMAA